MALIIYTDPHIGVNRAGNTTPASREALRQSILSTLYGVIDMKEDGHQRLCLGDLFDTYSNPEPVIRQGMRIVEGTTLTLAGNHDVVADADKMGSMQLIAEQFPGKVVQAPFGVPTHCLTYVSNIAVAAVPHVTTQSLFEEALDQLYIAVSTEVPAGKTKILCLHCNYDSPHELTETSLNLTPERAERLLNQFDYIFLGHEHQPRDLFDGRLVILGNIHPTGFSDISDKRIAIIDEDGLRFEQVWSKAAGYAEIDIGRPELGAQESAQFIRVTGTVSSEDIGTVSRSVSNLWKTCPSLLALKSEVVVEGVEQQETGGAEVTAETLPALVERELADHPARLAMWKEFTT
jgi:DNA repair exonuclease SbcCD nuclease subunit